MVKIIYFDIDGTLRDEQKGIPQSAIWAIEQCQKRQIQMVICTGRNIASIQDDVMALQMDGIISGGGCYIQYHGKEVFKKHFSMRVLTKVLSMAADWQLSLALETECKIYMDHNASIFYEDDFQYKIKCSGKTNQNIFRIENKITYEDNFEELWKETPKIHKICMFGSQAAIEKENRDLKTETEIIQKKNGIKDGIWNYFPKAAIKAVQLKN